MTFERRINLCFLAGAIPKDIQEDLLIINNIRNEFAHKIDINSFDIYKISSKCNKLQIVNYVKRKFKYDSLIIDNSILIVNGLFIIRRDLNYLIKINSFDLGDYLVLTFKKKTY